VSIEAVVPWRLRIRIKVPQLCTHRLLQTIRWIAIVSAMCAISLTALCAGVDAQGPEPKGFDVATDQDFRNFKQVVTEFAHKHSPRSDNDFCIAGYITPDNLKNAWIIWRQGRQIILWEGQTADLDAARRKIDLKSDVVPTENDLHGSTYLVTKAWVENVTSNCERSGVKVHVSKSKTHRR
jgi:hypothetical protein